MKIIVIGAGIFGVSTSIKLSEMNYDVTLVETNSSIMGNASKCNHNRLHLGYHYPRSYSTAKQSLDGYALFQSEFKNSILKNFPNYYLVDRNGKVSSTEYETFCGDLELDYTKETPDIDINLDNIDLSLLTKEPIFDFNSIKDNLTNRLTNSNVKTILNHTIVNKDELNDYDVIINTTYKNINKINSLFEITPIKLKLQDVIVPIFKCNMERVGLTIMDGEFCSILPKGFDINTFLLYSVKHSVIRQYEGYEVPSEWETDEVDVTESIDKIYSESTKYFYFLKDSERINYWRTIRALPINEDDERLSSLTLNEVGDKKIISLLSGKITTCWLMADKIYKLLDEDNINR